MDQLRDVLISKIDALLSQVFETQDLSRETHLQLEACIFRDQRRSGPKVPPRRIVLDTIKLDDYRQSLASEQPRDEVNENSQVESSWPPTPASTNTETDQSLQNVERGTTLQTSQTHNTSLCKASGSTTRRKEVGGLRLGHIASDAVINTPPRTPTPPTTRQLETNERQFPKRRKLDHDGPAKLRQSTVDKLIEGVWEQIHKARNLALGRELGEMFNTVNKRLMDGIAGTNKRIDFEDASRCCQQITSGSRTSRALEVIVQAHWIDCYEARINALHEDRPDLKTTEVKKIVLIEACRLFQWSEKELRNRMAIWKGYKEIKDAAGWGALIFAGPGIYRFCKYRLGFDKDALSKLQLVRTRLEVAADTLQPKWRDLLSLVGAPTQLHWRGHPHDWVVSRRKDPVPLAFTYRQVDPSFTFEHINESIIDGEKWNDTDPRRISLEVKYTCQACSGQQSMLAEQNECECFPDLFGPAPRTPSPVQIFRTDSDKMNGLIACCPFERGQAVGEFVGLVTKGLNGVDVMQGQAGHNEPYQIWQGRYGNFTRFINHSCQPNCEFQLFTWLGIQRVVVVSKGVLAGKEITVDYSGKYWQGLDKACLCGEARCRYKNKP